MELKTSFGQGLFNRLALFVVSALLTASAPLSVAVAGHFRSALSGGELLEKCGAVTAALEQTDMSVPTDRIMDTGYCLGFVEAAAEAGSFVGALPEPQGTSVSANAQRSIRNCADPSVDGETLLRVAIRFLGHHPDSSEQSAVATVMLAIARAYPCSDV